MSSSTSSPQALYNPEVESSLIAALVQYGIDVWADLTLINEGDFSPTNRSIFALVKQELDKTPPGAVTPLMIAERAKGIGLRIENVEILDLLEALRIRFVQKKDVADLARELRRITVRRQLVEKAHAVQRELVARPNASFEEMTGLVEKTLSSINTEYHNASEFTNVFDSIIEVTERRADNPLDASTMGYMGPFQTMNRICGAITDKGLLVTVGARTGNQKSALGFHYNLFLAEKYGVPILLMDVGEMSLDRIQRRAACCMAEGRVPLWAIASGEWRQNKEWKHVIQHECWPRIKKLHIDYINVGNMSPREKIALIRRYYYKQVGRGNPFGILDDYLKGIEALGKNSAEYQAVGYYVNEVKSLITNEIPAWYWTSVQNNRSGVYQGKKVADITDSEDQMGLSDRIIQQSDWGFILRFKVVEEIAAEQSLFGNMKLTPVKTRELLGKHFDKGLKPVRLPTGKFSPNYFNLESQSFHFTERGDLNHMLSILGKGPVDMRDKAADGQPKKDGGGL